MQTLFFLCWKKVDFFLTEEQSNDVQVEKIALFFFKSLLEKQVVVSI